ncbi:MAG: N-acetylglucosamine-6-phosphate deacetylase [Ruminococcaceae bacterium]|nr:N-acetylglucosamine-6-phosphate deacetylase [Oscillospiraceae bacterium]
MRVAYTNGLVITPNERFLGGVIVEGERIVNVFRGTLSESVDQIIDLCGAYLAPGFIDLHVHGAGGADFSSANPDDYETAAKLHLHHGTTALMPTISSTPIETMKKALRAYRAAKDKSGMPMFLGAHMEGPYFAPEQAGAQDPKVIRNPLPEEYLPFLDEFSDCIGRWSNAVELPGALEMGLELRKRGIMACLGHSDATYDQIMPALDYGYTMMTHFYSGMAGVRRINAYRHAGAVETGYLMDEFDVEIIADGHHLPASLLKLIYKTKGSGRICLITDAIAGAGMPDGTVFADDAVPYIVEDGVGKLLDRSAFAGSVTTSNLLIKTMVEEAEVPLCDAVKMLTLTPARIAGVDAEMGSLVPGKLANIVAFDADYQVQSVMVKGQVVEL